MRKPVILALALSLALLITACKDNGGTSESDSGASSGDEDVAHEIKSVEESIFEEALANNAFNLDAALTALNSRGLGLPQMEPDWGYSIDEDYNQAYGDANKCVINFMKNEGLLSDEEFNAWLKKAFDATAKASDDGYNIQGFPWGMGDIEMSWEEFFSDSIFIPSWSYKYGGIIIDVFVNHTMEKDSEYGQDENGEWAWTNYYNGVQLEVTTGLQKSWDETWADIEHMLE